MQSIGPFVEYAVFAVLIVLSIMAVAITFERLRFYRTVQATRYTSRSRLYASSCSPLIHTGPRGPCCLRMISVASCKYGFFMLYSPCT